MKVPGPAQMGSVESSMKQASLGEMSVTAGVLKQ